MSARSMTRNDAIATIEGLRENLDAVLDLVDEQRRTDISPEQQSYLNDYAVVRMAGYLEQLCFHAISGRIGEVSSGDMQTFINSWFWKSPNLDPDQFRNLFGRFGAAADTRVKTFLSEGLNREVLKSLLEIRNSVAHGKDLPQGGMRAIATYRLLVDEVEALVRALLLDEPATLQ